MTNKNVQPKVSVIIPVYNVEKYLRECLDSVVNQTLKDIEIICVNDASTDSSPQILKEYAAKDDRIRIINQPNQGAAVARNHGITEATAKYLSFVDSDDITAPQMLQKMFDCAEATSSDIIICRYANIKRNGNITEPPYLSDIDKQTFGVPFSSSDLNIYNITNFAIWNKLFRRDFIVSNNIVFQNLTSANDVAFGMLSLAEASKICCLNDVLYTYRQYACGNISSKRGNHAENIVVAAEYIRQELMKRGLWEKLSDNFYNLILQSFRYEYNLCPLLKKAKLLQNYRKFLPWQYYNKEFKHEHPLLSLFFSKQKRGNKRIIRFLGIKIAYTKKTNKISFKSFSQLTYCIRKNLYKLPEHIDLIVGIPRSGILPAYIIGLFLNKPVCSLNEFIKDYNEFMKDYEAYHGYRTLENSSCKNILIVDDSVHSGRELIRVKKLLADKEKAYNLHYLCIYAHQQSKHIPDIYFEIVPQPRLFQWNYLNYSIAGKACFDIDGVLCFNPKSEQNDDSKKYLEFLNNARPLYIPKYKIRAIVTSRLEKYRAQTEQWLHKNGVEYDELYMLNLKTAQERRALKCHADFKANIYAKLKDCILFVESDENQAKEIFNKTGKTVICVETDEIFGSMSDQ